MKSHILTIGLLLSLIFLSACTKPSLCNGAEAGVIGAVGTAGCPMIVTLADGTNLEVRNGNDYDLSGLGTNRVWIKYAAIQSASICQVGQIVEASCIKAREP